MRHCKCGETDPSQFYKGDRQCKACRLQWCKDNRSVINEYRRKRYKKGGNFRTACLLRTRLQHALNGTNKSASTLTLLGCTVEHLIEHLQSQLPAGANLADYHIDHIRPCASFDLTDPMLWRVRLPVWVGCSGTAIIISCHACHTRYYLICHSDAAGAKCKEGLLAPRAVTSR